MRRGGAGKVFYLHLTFFKIISEGLRFLARAGSRPHRERNDDQKRESTQVPALPTHAAPALCVPRLWVQGAAAQRGAPPLHIRGRLLPKPAAAGGHRLRPRRGAPPAKTGRRATIKLKDFKGSGIDSNDTGQRKSRLRKIMYYTKYIQMK